jgi:acetoin utilization protein AcuB
VNRLPIAALMKPVPATISPSAPLIEAHRAMRDHRVHHLVVIDEGRLVGLLSLDDLHLMETLGGVDPRQVPIDDAMNSDVFVVEPSAPAAVVAAGMLERDTEAAVVVDAGRVAGIFTARDAIAALVHLLGPAGEGSQVLRRPS